MDQITIMKRRAKLTENLERVLAVIPADGTPITQAEVYKRLGEAQSIGSYLAALQRRGLIQSTNGRWQRV